MHFFVDTTKNDLERTIERNERIFKRSAICNFGGFLKRQSKAKYPQNRLFLRMNLSAVNQRMQNSGIKEKRIKENNSKASDPAIFGHFR